MKEEITQEEIEELLKDSTYMKNQRRKGLIGSAILTLLICWFVSFFVDINPFLIFVLVQGISFIQALIGPWIASFFE